MSIHSASTNSVTSAHLADLQHQVTLKSLALQTLQSEYASLLQKLQRERVKSQTIEKKTSVADQEVNDLTGKNEELTDQVKSLEAQLEQSEKKREAERADASREKEQWGRMLDMGGRLHAKNAEDKQKLAEEKDVLLQRIKAYEEDNNVRFDQIRERLSSNMESSQRGSDAGGVVRDAGVELDSTDGTVGRLKQQVFLLEGRISVLRYALETVRQQSHDLDDGARRVVSDSERICDAIDRALNDEQSAVADAQALVAERHPRDGSRSSTPSRGKPSWSPTVLPTFYPPSVKAKAISSLATNSSPSTVETRVDSLDTRSQHADPVASDGLRQGGNVTQPTHSSPRVLHGPSSSVPAPVRYMQTPSSSLIPPSSAEQPQQFAPSPYTGDSRAPTHGPKSLNSHNSSPDPTMSDGESSSSGSGAKLSPARFMAGVERAHVKEEPSMMPGPLASANRGFASFRPYSADSTDTATAMPPPPRPFS